MKILKSPFLIIFLLLTLLLTSCFSSGKSRKSDKRYHQRCDCSRFSELSNNSELKTIDWVAYHAGQTDTK